MFGLSVAGRVRQTTPLLPFLRVKPVRGLACSGTGHGWVGNIIPVSNTHRGCRRHRSPAREGHTMIELASYTIRTDPHDPDCALVVDGQGPALRIHRHDADPEHRFTIYRLVAAWFANQPA